ncbi:DnaJ-like protein subfamily A member 3, mitochondrial [Frankliniella fusca]|uniref:DnaJ-like protein subfamily A member 3, mitochondrial n=1 Tax=Frankliniella fusca TaxID=407009 RepID=A0AAE1HJK2_9NEOP|nr:DnaJ-like protein subfamily A member 3, mitochondrial [Frankliniella fusca]
MNRRTLLTWSSLNARHFSSSVLLHQKSASHYETLGIGRHASQADIKAAFYKLSKKYHPDANVNDPTSTSKFQEIAEAYEILGNEDSRMRYDKGMGSIPGTTARRTGFKTADDPKAAFYKSRLINKMNSPTVGKMYNFDEWTKEHYSRSVVSNRSMKEEMKWRTPQDFMKKKSDPSYFIDNLAKYIIIFIVMGFVTSGFLQGTDSVKPK